MCRTLKRWNNRPKVGIWKDSKTKKWREKLACSRWFSKNGNVAYREVLKHVTVKQIQILGRPI